MADENRKVYYLQTSQVRVNLMSEASPIENNGLKIESCGATGKPSRISS